MKINFKLLLLSLLFSLNVSAGLNAGSGEVADSSITSAKILNGTIVSSDISDGAIVSADITTSITLTTPTVSGDLTLAAGGIKFPATQFAVANANTLDDYEEGTFTPTVVGTGAAGVGTYTSQVGFYTKIGRFVQVLIYLNWTAHTGTGNFNLGGLPFTAAGSNAYAGMAGTSANIAMTANYYYMAYVNSGATTVELNQGPTGGGASIGIPMDTSAVTILSGTYIY